ncbi:MAG: oligopeptide ABC transporter substrate-binding protein, partial [Alphaproteobacteria bacterium]|nr:oligopeptide ABC transporter substrate-binding protein [Alphaproteobacteria bacterium]
MIIGRRRVLQGALAAPAVLAPAVLTSGALAQTDARPVLRIAVADLPPTLEPARELSNVGTRVIYSIYDTLIRRDFLGAEDGGGTALKPHLATSWERRSSRELVVTLRDGVRFHNGDVLTADDVAFTFAEGRMWGDAPKFLEARAFFGVLDAVEALDARTVAFRTRAPDVLLEHRLASWAAQIVNRRAYEALGAERHALMPVGTGPYRVRRLAIGERLELDAFDDYWMGRPTARAVIFQSVPELASRTAGLASGEFDIITNVPPDQLGEIQRFRDAAPRSVVLANAHLLTFDQRGAAMADKRVRQALALAIDRPLLVE